MSGNQEEIIKLRKSGIEVSQKILQPEFVFYCDSTIENLINYHEWEKYPSIVVECTGYPEVYEPKLVQSRGHTHYTDLVEVIKNHKTKNLFLIHSSMKTDKEFLLRFQEEISKISENVKILSLF